MRDNAIAFTAIIGSLLVAANRLPAQAPQPLPANPFLASPQDPTQPNQPGVTQKSKQPPPLMPAPPEAPQLPPSPQPPPHKGAPSTLEEMLDTALKDNPDIILAEAKLREAEAELNRIQQQVLAKIVVTYHEIKTGRALVIEAEKQLDQLTRLGQQGGNRAGIVSAVELSQAQGAFVKYKADLERKEAELPLLIGKTRLKNFSIELRTAEPSQLKTYFVLDDAEALAKKLQEIYNASPGVRITPIGQKQLMVYAPLSIQAEIKNGPLANDLQKRELEEQQHAAVALFRTFTEASRQLKNTPGKDIIEKYRKALEKQVKFEGYEGPAGVQSLTTDLQTQLGKEVNLLVGTQGQWNVAVPQSATMPLAAALQLIEDQTPLRFYVRDYGIVGLSRTQPAPEGAPTIGDFLKLTAPEPPPKSGGK